MIHTCDESLSSIVSVQPIQTDSVLEREGASNMGTEFTSPALSVKDLEVTIMKPIQKTVHLETIDPTFMDKQIFDLYIPTFAAYRLPGKSEGAYLQLLDRIKDSLRKVLVPYFPFAGRWVGTFGGSGRQLLCNDEGVPFITAYVDRDLDSVVRASDEFQPVPELQGFEVVGMDASQLRAKMRPEGLPAIFVQVTRFKCGGVVLGVTFSHMLTDAQAFFDFMTAWSDISLRNETAIQPDHNRAWAKSYEGVFPAPVAGVDNGDLTTPKKFGVWALKTFEVSRSTVESLKREAKESGEGAYVSTGDCIVAHIWRNVARLPSSILGNKEVAVVNLVEGRNRFYDPPMPNLCGNVFTPMICPKIPMEELQERPLYFIALKIREKLLATKRETWFSIPRAMESFEALAPGSDKYLAWVNTSWFSFPMYEIDFGSGKPFFASGINSSHAMDGHTFGIVSIAPPIPGRPSSVATVCVKSTRQVLEAIESQPDFPLLFLH